MYIRLNPDLQINPMNNFEKSNMYKITTNAKTYAEDVNFFWIKLS